MKKFLLVLVLMSALSLVGCPTLVLQDETQLENLTLLEEAHAAYHTHFEAGEVPPEFLVDSVDTLLEAAVELEASKAESWQEQAVAEGWVAPEEIE